MPRRILRLADLERLSFPQAIGLRALGKQIGYFHALEQARLTSETPGFDDSYERFLLCLTEYLEAMALEARIELTDWQQSWLRRRIEGKIETQRNWQLFVLTAPIALLVGLHGLFGLNLLPHALQGGAVAGKLGSAVVGWLAQRRRATLQSVLDGSSLLRAGAPRDES